MEHAIDTSSEPTGAEPEACAWPLRLDHLEIGKDVVVASVDADDQALRQHILDMGLTPGTEVTMMKYAPMGDPIEIRLRGGYELTLRRAGAARIVLANIHDAHELQRENAAVGSTEHPALGEDLSPRPGAHPIPAGNSIALPSPLRKDHAFQPAYGLQPTCR